MLTRVFSAAIQGVEAIQVEIEVNAGSGDPVIVLVGLPDAAVRESKDRVTTAIANSGLRWPRSRTTVNLAPADLRKEGPSFDLPIAVGMIAVAQGARMARLGRCLMAGELALNGAVRPIKGALPIALEARRQRKKAVILPKLNAREAAVVEGIEVYGVSNLRETYEFLAQQRELEPLKEDTVFTGNGADDLDFSEVKGQRLVKRAIEVAVASNHALLLIGPPRKREIDALEAHRNDHAPNDPSRRRSRPPRFTAFADCSTTATLSARTGPSGLRIIPFPTWV